MPGLETAPLSMRLPSAYNDDVYCGFFLDKYFSFGNWNEELEHNKGWIWFALQSPSENPVSSYACRSLVTAFFANVTRTETLRRDAFCSHRDALAALKLATEQEITFDVLSAIVLLALYEACFHTMQSAWQQHMKAFRYLAKLKGPDFFRERPARSLLMLSRHQLISDSIISRERCFLENPAWSGILTSDDREASLTIKLGDLVLQQGGLFQDIKATEKTGERNLVLLESLHRRLERQLDDLRQWWSAWSMDPGRLPVRLPDQKVEGQMEPPPPVQDGHRPTVLHFRNLEAAAGYCRYHAHVILAQRWINRLIAKNPIMDAHSKLIPEEESVLHAKAICEALHYYSLPQHRHIGAVYKGLPARVAWQALPEGCPHATWIEKLMEFLADNSGFTLSRYILRHIEVDD